METNITMHAGAAARAGGSREGRAPRNAARLPKGLRFEGQASFAGDLAVEGEMCGTTTLDADGVLIVAPAGRVEGLVHAGHAHIEGCVDGEIDCSGGHVQIEASARCKVKVLYTELSVARGADLEADLHRVTEACHG